MSEFLEGEGCLKERNFSISVMEAINEYNMENIKEGF